MTATRSWSLGPWGYTQPWDVEKLGPSILDEDEQRRWSRQILLGGLPYIWREAGAPMNSIVYSLMSIRPGDKVLLIGESLEPCGWPQDLRRMVGPEGRVDTFELLEEARDAYDSKMSGRNGKPACWKWRYTEAIERNTYDVVAVMQAVQHCDDWQEGGAELLRVLKPGRPLILAEACIFGAPFWARMEADLHLVYWVEKLTKFFPPFDIRQTPYYSPQELHAAFTGQLDDPQYIEWRGVELFWGRKPADSRAVDA